MQRAVALGLRYKAEPNGQSTSCDHSASCPLWQLHHDLLRRKALPALVIVIPALRKTVEQQWQEKE